VADNKRLIGVFKIRDHEPDFCIRDTREAIDKRDLSRFVHYEKVLGFLTKATTLNVIWRKADGKDRSERNETQMNAADDRKWRILSITTNYGIKEDHNAESTIRSHLLRLCDEPIVVRNIRCFLLWLVSRRVATTAAIYL